MGRPMIRPRPHSRVTSLDYLNQIEVIDPDKERNTKPFLPGYARLAVRKLQREEEQLKQLEG